jgi:hypothetical protein
MTGKIGVLDNEKIEVAVRSPMAMGVRAEKHHAPRIADTANPGDDLVQELPVHGWECGRLSHGGIHLEHHGVRAVILAHEVTTINASPKPEA